MKWAQIESSGKMVLEGAVLEEAFLDGAEIDRSEIVDGLKLLLTAQ